MTWQESLSLKHLLQEFDTFDAWLADRGHPPYRSRQIQKWLAHRRAISFHEMTDLPANLRDQLAATFTIDSMKVQRQHHSPDGTDKLLMTLGDRQNIECVLLRDENRRTICISSQVGCGMGCVFCASGLDGVERNLTRGEIIEQMLHLQRLLNAEERLSHIVMMGMGEPLANLESVLSALKFASSPEGLGISPRRITISTVGLPAAIDRLAKSGCQYNLAISLHAPTDELRNRLVPVNHRIGLSAILESADRYFEVSGRRLTFEYVLLAGINDAVEHAERLARLLQGRNMLLNVIPYNPVAGLPYATPSADAIRQFRRILESRGITVKFRQRKGDQINAACGQLRRLGSDLQKLNG